MKHLKTYNQINEGLRYKMIPKSDDEILSSLDKLSTNDIIEHITRIWYSNRFKFKQNPIDLFLKIIKDVTGRDIFQETRKNFIQQGFKDDKYLDTNVKLELSEAKILYNTNFTRNDLYNIFKYIILI